MKADTDRKDLNHHSGLLYNIIYLTCFPFIKKGWPSPQSLAGETGTQRSLSRSRSPNRQVAARMLRQKTLILGDSEDDKSDFDDSQAPP